MIKKDEILDDRSCLNKAKPLEPLFVLRAQDVLAGDLVRQWARTLHARRCATEGQGLLVNTLVEPHAMSDCPLPKVQEALKLAFEMDTWPTRKLPD